MVYTVKAEDPVLIEVLTQYHRELLSNNDMIAERLKADHNIIMRYVVLSPLHVTVNVL